LRMGSKLASDIRALRRKGLISHEINVAYFPPRHYGPGEVYMNCDAGRIRRPLIVVEGGTPKLTPGIIGEDRIEGDPLVGPGEQWGDRISRCR
jgi:DNA-directed RNA polymerase beta subunit